jgi:hypothetical protein
VTSILTHKLTHVHCFQMCCMVESTLSIVLKISWQCHFWIAKCILQLEVMFSTTNDNWEVIENIVEKRGFFPNAQGCSILMYFVSCKPWHRWFEWVGLLCFQSPIHLGTQYTVFAVWHKELDLTLWRLNPSYTR